VQGPSPQSPCTLFVERCPENLSQSFYMCITSYKFFVKISFIFISLMKRSKIQSISRPSVSKLAASLLKTPVLSLKMNSSFPWTGSQRLAAVMILQRRSWLISEKPFPSQKKIISENTYLCLILEYSALSKKTFGRFFRITSHHEPSAKITILQKPLGAASSHKLRFLSWRSW